MYIRKSRPARGGWGQGGGEYPEPGVLKGGRREIENILDKTLYGALLAGACTEMFLICDIYSEQNTNFHES